MEDPRIKACEWLDREHRKDVEWYRDSMREAEYLRVAGNWLLLVWLVVVIGLFALLASKGKSAEPPRYKVEVERPRYTVEVAAPGYDALFARVAAAPVGQRIAWTAEPGFPDPYVPGRRYESWREADGQFFYDEVRTAARSVPQDPFTGSTQPTDARGAATSLPRERARGSSAAGSRTAITYTPALGVRRLGSTSGCLTGG